MKRSVTISLTTLLSVLCLLTKAQTPKDACSLIVDEQINKVIGCKVTQTGGSIMKGKYCTHKAADFKSEVTVQYYDWHTAKTAAEMQKMNYDENKKDIATGKKAVGVYTSIKDFPEGGQNAYIATGEGDLYSNGSVVRSQFFIGNIQYTFDTKGIDKNKVVSGMKEIYNIIRNNSK
jgi:hypothetical protein